MKVLWNLVVHNLKALLYFFEAIFQLFVQPPKKSIKGKVVLITGAGNGIGKSEVVLCYLHSQMCLYAIC